MPTTFARTADTALVRGDSPVSAGAPTLARMVNNSLRSAPGRAGRHARLPRLAAFWLLVTALALMLFASSAPSPLYPIYQQQWHYSALVSTGVYATNVLALLATLLTAGSLSDHIGRRPVLFTAAVTALAGTLIFAEARSVTWLFAARGIQGIAAGLSTGAISAALIDLQPPGSRLGVLMSSIAAGAGSAAGAMSCGLLVAFAPAPTHLVFWLLAAAYAALIVGVTMMPETVTPDGRALDSLIPKVSVPQSVRSVFRTLLPSVVATWALGGLYLSLGGALMRAQFHLASPLAGGLVILALQGASLTAAVLTREWTIDRLLRSGPAFLVSGVAIALTGVATREVALFLVGSSIAGIGCGPTFTGILRMLTGLTEADRRAEVITATYVAAYLAFSLPAVLAGLCLSRFDLSTTAFGYGVIVLVLELGAVLSSHRHHGALDTLSAAPPCPAPCPGTVAANPHVVAAHA
ncbi:MFS transporter [Nocardia stercoris]|uniref:MFS transporter n=1 Tax=Nocardia stercoris TaxID=2483361 RepID=A0A3M2L868_9NOCA|nr:MFS transporter [Nocardia stercoris]RMI33216.1 MFS transporter [Nocardia stercoris]